MLFTFTTNLLQRNLRKLETNGVSTVDQRFLGRFPLKNSRQIKRNCCWFYHQSEPLNEMTDQEL